MSVALARDLLRDLLTQGRIDPAASIREPLVIHEATNALQLTEALRKSPVQLAVILDEYGALQGIATPTDILEAIAGDFPDEGEEPLRIEREAEGQWLLSGWIDIRHASEVLGTDLRDDAGRYVTLAGYVLLHLGRLAQEGETVHVGNLSFEMVKLQGYAIDTLRVTWTG